MIKKISKKNIMTKYKESYHDQEIEIYKYMSEKYINYEDMNRLINTGTQMRDLIKLLDSREVRTYEGKLYITSRGAMTIVKYAENKSNLEELIRNIIRSDLKRANLISEDIKVKELINYLEYDGKNILYLIYVGTDEEKQMNIKFGITMNCRSRMRDHKKMFDIFNLFYVKECANNKIIEREIKKKFKRHEMIVNGHHCTEIIKINNIKGLIKEIDTIISSNYYVDESCRKKINDLEDEIKELRNKNKMLEDKVFLLEKKLM